MWQNATQGRLQGAQLMPLYAVIRRRSGTYQKLLPLVAQVDWATHAAFMDALVSDGFVLFGGPLEGTDDVLLIVRASSAGEVASRFAQDPWSATGMLQISRILPWTLRLGSLPH
jgi:uncharacterized protein YciI